MLLLLASIALAGDDIHIVEDGATETLNGPAVWMEAPLFRKYVSDSRNLPVCLEALEKASDKVLAANERTLRARDIALAEFEADEILIDEQVQIIADLGAKLDQADQARVRLQQQRNVAWGIAGGFLAASTAAVVLSLD